MICEKGILMLAAWLRKVGCKMSVPERSRRVSTLVGLAVLVRSFALLVPASAVAAPTWEGGQVNCRPDQQARLVINYRGVLHIQWSERGGASHVAGPYYSPFYKTLECDTGAFVANWRAEAKVDNDGIPGDIGDAYATCV